MSKNIKRILVYTHNSIGLGHAFRTLAVITGIRKWRPDINFLVISSTSVPQIFFDEGIDVIKLPSVKLDIDCKSEPMQPRYLADCDLESIFDFRQRLILETFDFFRPDVLLVEHNMTGQMSELMPLLMKKWMRQGGPADFILAHMCRGIMRWVPLLSIPYQNPRHRSESINIGKLYDFMYVLEDRQVIDINKAFLGNDPELEKKIRYLGKITNKIYEELPDRQSTLSNFALPDKPVILVSLGRNRMVPVLSKKLLQIFEEAQISRDYQVLMVLDTYLDRELACDVRSYRGSKSVRFLDFVPDLVDLVNHSELVISRAGYNTFNEVLLTGAKALLIPESHGSREQEQRCRSVPYENIVVKTEEELLLDDSVDLIRNLLNGGRPRVPTKFNKYELGKAMIEEMEEWTTQKHESRNWIAELRIQS